MKLRVIAGIMVTLLLVSVAFYAVPTTAAFVEPPIKIGIIGPMYWIQGTGMWEGALLAQKKINDAGGILGHEVQLYQASTHSNAGEDPTSTGGATAATTLLNWGADFVVGGFRTEAVEGARSVLMPAQRIFIIDGASTDELIDKTPVSYYPNTVRANYAKYKYMFRVTPVNSTMLFKSIAAFLKTMMIYKLMPIFSGYYSPTQLPLKIAVVSENLAWTYSMHYFLTWEDWWNLQTAIVPQPPPGQPPPPYPPGTEIPGMGMTYPPALGYPPLPGIDVVYEAKVDPVSTAWVPGTLAGIEASGARLIIEVISGPSGRGLVSKWAELQTKAALVGIDVPGQEIALHWTATGGKCETESFLVTAGGADDKETGTPINTIGPVKTVDYYRDYYTAYGHAPIYTSYGTFDTIMALKETIEQWKALPQVGHDWPPANQAEYDLLIPVMEKTDRNSLTGHFKYTGPNPGHKGDFSDYDPVTADNQPYPFSAINPTMQGTLHDVYSDKADLSPYWPSGYVRALVGSWQAGRLEVVFPVDQSYSKGWGVPYWVYPYRTDVNQNRQHDATDLVIVSYAYNTKPGDRRWNFIADTDDYLKPLADRDVDGDDLVRVSYDYGIPIPVQP